MKKIIQFILLFAGLAQARPTSVDNKEVGNGGDVVVCRDVQKQITSIELLDYYEARELRQIQINTIPLSSQMASSEAIKALVIQTLDRLETLNPNRRDKYKIYLDTFFDEALFVKGKTLTDIPDSSHLFLPLGCQIEQIAIQLTPQYQA